MEVKEELLELSAARQVVAKRDREKAIRFIKSEDADGLTYDKGVKIFSASKFSENIYFYYLLNPLRPRVFL